MIAAGIAVCLGASAFAGFHWFNSAVHAPGPLATGKAVVVPHAGTTRLTEDLAADGVLDRPLLFQAAVWLTRNRGTLHAAEFLFPPRASIAQVLAILRTAKPVEHHLTIPEGLTAHQITAIIDHTEAMTGPVPTIDEGSVMPQTYDYQYGTGRIAVVTRAKAAMEKDLAAAWTDREAGLPLTTARDALILASIVERETARPEERPHVAAVYLNRLRQGMKLQADPTVIYLASGGAGVLDHRLTRSELGQDNPFNTYRNPGLPPAPICSPGISSLNAVLHPDHSDDLFFVADGTGGHIFSRTYEAHDTAVAHWRARTSATSHGSPD